MVDYFNQMFKEAVYIESCMNSIHRSNNKEGKIRAAQFEQLYGKSYEAFLKSFSNRPLQFSPEDLQGSIVLN